MRKIKSDLIKSDLEECRDKIKELLIEYNCSLMSADEWSNILIIDNDTQETLGSLNL